MAHRLTPVIAMAMLAMTVLPVAASTPTKSAGLDADAVLVADLEGEPIPLVVVGRFHCTDLDVPAIHCFRSVAGLSASFRAEGSLNLLAGVDYVHVWENANYSGSSMVMSQDYSALSFLGWNDRISSYKGRNSQTGTFYTDWFAGGSADGFCCNQQVASLGGFNDTFSSVYNN